METIIESLKSMYPKVSIADWFFAFMGLALHAVVKLKTVPFKQFRWKIFLEDFVVVWLTSIMTIAICLGTLPYFFQGYSVLDSALVGYSSSSLLRSLLKQKLSKLGLNEDENKG